MCIYLSVGEHLRLAVEGKITFIYYLFPNICTHISEYYFKIKYMLIDKEMKLES